MLLKLSTKSNINESLFGDNDFNQLKLGFEGVAIGFVFEI